MLVDGNRTQIDAIQAEVSRRQVSVHIVLTFVHLLKCVWKAAWAFFCTDDPAAARVGQQTVKILAGKRDRSRPASAAATTRRNTPHRMAAWYSCRSRLSGSPPGSPPGSLDPTIVGVRPATSVGVPPLSLCKDDPDRLPTLRREPIRSDRSRPVAMVDAGATNKDVIN